MSTYFKMWNSTITAKDPATYIPEAPPMVGQMSSGKPITQGLEYGTLTWNAVTLAGWIDIRDKYNTNKDTAGTFVIPGNTAGQSWTTWRSVTAYVVEQPKCEYKEKNVFSVTMQIVITG